MVKSSKSRETEDLANFPLQWTIDVDTMAGHGTDFVKSASAEERGGLASALGLVSCDALKVRLHVARPGDHVYFVTGTLKADVVQSCVVTLEPIAQTVETDIEVQFRPVEHIPEAQGAIDLGDDVDIEPLAGHFLPVGRLVFEELAAALDPYPRKSGAAFGGLETDPEAAKRANPFAVLAQLKDKKTEKPDG